MFLEIRVLKGSRGARRKIVLQCDVCKKHFEKSFCKATLEKCKKSFSFCSKKCVNESQKKNGLLFEQKKNYFLKKFGVENPFCIPEVHEKSIKAAQNEDVVMRRKQTNIQRYGCENVMSSPDVKRRQQQTCLEHFGYKTKFADPLIAEMRKETSLLKYGTEHPTQSELVKTTNQQTCLKRFGVSNVHQVPVIIQKTRDTFFERYGVSCAFNIPRVRELASSPESQLKKHETKKCNGSYTKSTPEEKLYTWLVGTFGVRNVQRHVLINGWDIDFYVSDGNFYVQEDGNYYHGLDRPLSEIAKFKSETDKVIFGTWHRDREQEIWFKENNLTLIRITEEQVKRTLKNG